MKMLLAFLLFSQLASAQTSSNLSETFYSTTNWDQSNSTLVWNPYFHILHAPLAITFTSNVNTQNASASVGNGQDGIFDVGTYANFSVGGVTPGNIITIDTSVHPVLQVIYFNLAAGWSIRGVGPNPLWIESFGPVTISGLIDCSGDPGAGTDNITTSATLGGAGHCGGGNGGNGGFGGGLATAGATAGGTTTAGGAGGAGSPGGGGGGGGSFRSNIVGSPTAGGGVGGSPGTAGVNNNDDPQFAFFGLGIGGGSGGGGGGYNAVALARGAGGGGGGGVIRITSVGNITVNSPNGKLFTAGGVGGGGVALGGAGGGGGAGGIWLQSAGSITEYVGGIDAGIHSGPPDGSNAGVVAGGNNGGVGSDGRTWLTLNATHDTPPAETPYTELGDEGETFFSILPGYVAQSLAYDSGNTAPNYNLFQMISSLPGTATATLLIAGSSDNFVTDNTGFLPPTNLTPLQAKRYFKFKVTLQQDSTSAPASTASSVNQVTASYINYQEQNFQFSQTCGYIAGGPPEGLFLLFLLALIYFLTSGRLRRRIPFPMTKSTHS